MKLRDLEKTVIECPDFKCYHLGDRLNKVGIDQIVLLGVGIVLLGVEYEVLTKAPTWIYIDPKTKRMYALPRTVIYYPNLDSLEVNQE